jgi:glycogen debranching enzyme
MNKDRRAMDNDGRAMNGDLLEEAAIRARAVLRACVTPRGIRASAGARGYREVWTRDAMIVLLGVCAARLEEFALPLRASLETLTARRSALGYIPLNVGEDGRPGTANAGAVDSNLWYVIGHRVLHETFGAADLIDRNRDAIRDAMLWARYQDSDDDGLIETQEAADWADLLASRGKVLYTNVLYTLALDSYARLATVADLPEGPLHLDLAVAVSRRINELLWVESEDGLPDIASSAAFPSAPALGGDHAESRRLTQLTRALLWSRPFYLPWVAFREFGDWCDVLGNSLAILAGIADGRRREQILTYFDEVGVASPYPAKSIHPPLPPGHRDWRDYYRNGNRSLPDQYHNGGIWPFVGGFLVAAHVHAGRRAQASALLARLAAAVREGHTAPFEFNEWHHGVTGRPMGAPLQAWSAAMYLYAHEAVRRGVAPFLAPVDGVEHAPLAAGRAD